MDTCEYLLHFGEGKAFFDTRLFELNADFVDAYDPYSPDPKKREYPEGTFYDKIVAIYVFNTLPPLSRRNAVNDAMELLSPGGVLIAAVRADKVLGAAHYDGVVTKRDTFQKSYTMAGVLKEFSHYGHTKVVYATPGYIIFTIKKD